VAGCLLVTLDGHREGQCREDEQDGKEGEAETGHFESLVYKKIDVQRRKICSKGMPK
jgi:hypothetical protein